jgi:glutamate decarboxylase
MPLHKVTRSGEPGIADVYATESADRCLPKYRMPEHAASAQAVYNLVHDELLLDGNSRQNLATFCTTCSEPEARLLMGESIDKNMIDKDEYPQTAEIENRCVHMIADLPAKRESTVIQRILIRHGVSRDLAQLLLDDLGRAL